jgi:hypothetical protein
VGAFSLVKLAATAIGDTIQRPDRKAHLGTVFQQQVIPFEPRFDRIEHLFGVPFVRANQADELAVPVQRCPDAGHLAQAALTGAAGHRHCEEPTFQHRFLDLADDFEMVVRTGHMKGRGEVALTEEAEVAGSARFPFGINDLRQSADVPACQCDGGIAFAGALLNRLVRIAFRLFGLVALVDQPGGIAKQIDVLAVTNPEAGSLAVPEQLPFVECFAQR